MIWPYIFVPSNSLCMRCRPVSGRIHTERNSSSVMVSCLRARSLNFVPDTIKFHLLYLSFAIPFLLLFQLPQIRSLALLALSRWIYNWVEFLWLDVCTQWAAENKPTWIYNDSRCSNSSCRYYWFYHWFS